MFLSQGCQISIFLYNFDIHYFDNWRLHVYISLLLPRNGLSVPTVSVRNNFR